MARTNAYRLSWTYVVVIVLVYLAFLLILYAVLKCPTSIEDHAGGSPYDGGIPEVAGARGCRHCRANEPVNRVLSGVTLD